jgi:hypothetical protein
MLSSLSAPGDQVENSFAQPGQYTPVSRQIVIDPENPEVEWPAFSINVLRIKPIGKSKQGR